MELSVNSNFIKIPKNAKKSLKKKNPNEKVKNKYFVHLKLKLRFYDFVLFRS